MAEKRSWLEAITSLVKEDGLLFRFFASSSNVVQMIGWKEELISFEIV